MNIRTLRGDLAAAVRRAGRGERIVVTVSGQPVAQLGPLDPGDGAAVTIADLAARGLVVGAHRGDRPDPQVIVPLPVGTRLDRLVAGIRG
ncbi:MAG: type II toxin-antitoxin system Phd/YefM family antitoxin [Acidimicrobiales bacterium]